MKLATTLGSILPCLTAAYAATVYAQCVDYDAFMTQATQLPVAGAVRSIERSGDIVFLEFDGENGASDGFHVVDVSSPADPQLLHTEEIPGLLYDMYLHGNLLLATGGPDGLRIFDVSDPANPTLLSHDILVFSSQVHAQGDLAFVAGASGVFHIVDISDPEQPAILSTTPVSGTSGEPTTTRDVYALGSAVYVWFFDTFTDPVEIFDASDPRAPLSQGILDHVGGNTIVFHDVGGRLYVGGDFATTIVYDVADPLQPVQIGYDTTSQNRDFLVDGDYLYAARANYGLVVADVSDPATFVDVGLWLASGYIYGVERHRGHVLLAHELRYAGGSELLVLKAETPTSVSALQRRSGWERSMAVTGDRIYTGDIQSNFRVNDRGNLDELGTTVTPGAPLGIAIANGHAYVADHDAGLTVVNVQVDDTPTVLTSIPTGGHARHVVIVGSLAYVSASSAGLLVFDISVPGQPMQVGSWTDGVVLRTVVSGEWAFLATTAGLVVLDVGTPSAPSFVTAVATPGYADSIDLDGDLLAVTGNDVDLSLFDVSNPSVPSLVVELQFHDSSADDVHLRNGYAYVMAHGATLALDVRDPAAPRILTTIDHALQGAEHLVVGETLYVAGRYGLATYPAPCEGAVPALLQRFEAIAIEGAVRLSGAVAGAEVDQLQVVGRQGAMTWRVAVVEAAAGRGFEAVDRSRFVRDGGPVVYSLFLQATDGSRTRLAERTVDLGARRFRVSITAVPSPFNPRTQVRFVAPQGERAVVTALDVRGRRVATLFEGTASGDAQVMPFEAEGLASGVYFVRLESGHMVRTTRVVLMK